MEENRRLLKRLKRPRIRMNSTFRPLAKGSAFYIVDGKEKLVRLTSANAWKQKKLRAQRIDSENAILSKRLRSCAGNINRRQFRLDFKEHKRLSKLRSRYSGPRSKIRRSIRRRDLLPSCFKTRKRLESDRNTRHRTISRSTSRHKLHPAYRRAIWRFHHYAHAVRMRSLRWGFRRFIRFSVKCAAVLAKRQQDQAEARRNAALMIQRVGVQYIRRRVLREVEVQRNASVKIQSRARGWLTKRAVNRRRIERQKAALHVLSKFFARMRRRRLEKVANCVASECRRLVDDVIASVITMQRLVRAHALNMEILNRRQRRENERAALRIQSILRGRCARLEFKRIQKTKRVESAAITIQSWIRVIFARHERFRRKGMREDEDAWISSRRERLLHRRRQRQSRHAKCHVSAMLVTPAYRLLKLYPNAAKSVFILQRIVRRYLSRQRKRRVAVVKIQKWIRGELSRDSYTIFSHNVRSAVTKIQSRVRGMLCRRARWDGKANDNDEPQNVEEDDPHHDRESSMSSVDNSENELEDVDTLSKMVSIEDERNSMLAYRSTREKKVGSSLTRGTFFGMYRKSKGGTLRPTAAE